MGLLFAISAQAAIKLDTMRVGDRIYTSYVGGEGSVLEITPYSTRVLLDSERDAMIPNTSIFTGMVQIAKLREPERSRFTS